MKKFGKVKNEDIIDVEPVETEEIKEAKKPKKNYVRNGILIGGAIVTAVAVALGIKSAKSGGGSFEGFGPEYSEDDSDETSVDSETTDSTDEDTEK